MQLTVLSAAPVVPDPAHGRHAHHTAAVHGVGQVDPRTAVSGGEDGRLVLWSLASGAVTGELTGHTGPVNDLHVRGRWMATAHDDGTARVWDLASRRLAATCGDHPRYVRRAAIAGAWVVTACEDHRVRVFDRESGALRHTLEGHQDTIHGLAVVDGVAVTSSPDHAVLAWDLRAAGPLDPLYDAGGRTVSAGRVYIGSRNTTGVGHPGSAPDVVVPAPDGVLTGAEGVIRWTLDGRRMRWHTPLAWPVAALAVHGDRVYAGTHTALVELDLEDGRVLRRLAWSDRGIRSLALVGDRLVVGSASGTVAVVDLARWVDPPHHAGWVGQVVAHGRYGASRDGAGVVNVFDLATGRHLGRLSPHPEPNERPIAIADALYLGRQDGAPSVSRWSLPALDPLAPLRTEGARPLPVGALAAGRDRVLVGPASARFPLTAWQPDAGDAAALEGRTAVRSMVALDGAAVTTGSFAPAAEEATFGRARAHLQGWDLASGRLAWTVPAQDGPRFGGPRFHPLVRLGDHVIAGSGQTDDAVCVWNARTGERGAALDIGAVYSGRGGPDHAVLITEGDDGVVTVVRVDAASHAVTTLLSVPDTASAIAVDSTYLVIAEGTTVTAHHLETRRTASVEVAGDVRVVALSGARVLVGRDDGGVEVVAVTGPDQGTERAHRTLDPP